MLKNTRNRLILCGLLLICLPLSAQDVQTVSSIDGSHVDKKTVTLLYLELEDRLETLKSLNVKGYGKPLDYSSHSCVEARNLINQWTYNQNLQIFGVSLIDVLYNSGCLNDNQFFSKLKTQQQNYNQLKGANHQDPNLLYLSKYAWCITTHEWNVVKPTSTIEQKSAFCSKVPTGVRATYPISLKDLGVSVK